MEDDNRHDKDKAANPGIFPAGEPGQSDRRLEELSVDFPVSVVLPAGGTGERTGLTTPKQFCSLSGRPLISYTIQAFERVSWIQSVVVVVAKESMDLMADFIQRFQHRKVRVVPGGTTRHRSIWNGILALGEVEGFLPNSVRPKVVIIHDAVRPFVEEDFLIKIARAAKEHGAAGAIRPLVSTVIATTSEGFLDHSLERAKYRASEMPQGFTYDIICQAYQRSSEYDFDFGTECLHLALQYCGTSAKLIEGPPSLWKVTYKRDLAAAESIVKDALSKSTCVVTGGSAAAESFAGDLQKTTELNMEVHVVPDLNRDNSSKVLKEFNFILVSVNSFDLSALKSTLKDLEASNQAVLHPLVVIWVYLTTSDEPSCISRTTAEVKAFTDVASEAKLRNTLIYGLQLPRTQDSECWRRSVLKFAEITSALVRERSFALVGQLLQV
ncbi:D-ribitol-5-phosphate cytidylyltransferase [Cynoglossus semilaevis]|uniref:D-ribitol-5-phosphate cytidylyltransferase n=1 Tax=Cynoglossus semilaevis TaxID=244447 RepID=A0A3P8WAN0_CYNSE|nr:D-ribitol-5-phosphate cytidylyltransferase [Cynoglossus semilaevis]